MAVGDPSRAGGSKEEVGGLQEWALEPEEVKGRARGQGEMPGRPADGGYAIISESMGQNIYHHHSLLSADKTKRTKMHSILTVSPQENGNRSDEDRSQPYKNGV